MILVLAAAAVLFLAPGMDASPAPPAPAATSVGRTQAGSLTVMGGTVTVPASEVRNGNVTLFGGMVDIEGQVTHDVTVFGGTATIDGSVGHDVTVLGGTVDLGPQSTVGHDVTVLGGTLNRSPGAQVGHDVTVGGRTSDVRGGFDLSSLLARGGSLGLPSPAVPVFPGFNLGLGFTVAAGLVVLAILLHLFVPAQVGYARDALEERPFAALGVGCLTVVAGVLLAAVLAVTVILVPVSLAIAIAIGAGWLLGWAGVLALIGQRLTGLVSQRADPVVALLVGGALVALLVNVPFLGGLFFLLAGSMALGAVTLTRFGTRPPPPAWPSYGPPQYGPPPGPPPAPPPQGPPAPTPPPAAG